MKRALVGLCMVLMSTFAWALPTEQQVQEAISQKNYTQAESMMAEVVGDKPNSAKAHYVYAELLAHNGNFDRASTEAAKARQLDPNIAFTDPAKFKSFEDLLRREQSNGSARSRAVPTGGSVNSSAPMTASSGGGIPGWVWLLGLVVVGMFIWRGFQRSRAMAGASMTGGQPGYGSGPGYGGPGAPMGGAPYGGYGPGGVPVQQPGRGMLGTIGAVGAGVAGGVLLDEMLHRNNGGSGGGGFIPDAGAATDSAGRDLQDRSIDFGSGNDWDSGGGGGGVDLGGGSDGGNWE